MPVIPAINLPANLSHISAEDVENNLRNFLRDKDGFSKNTLRDLMLVAKAYANWCAPRGYAWLPVDPENCRAYLFWLKEEKGRAVSTVTKHLAMLNMLMNISGLPKLTNEKSVSLGMRRLRRTAATAGERAGQAVPLHLSDLNVLDTLYKQLGTPAALRNRAFLFVAYNTMLRISEISRLRVRDIQTSGDNVTLFVAYTKTNTVTETIKQVSGWTAGALFDWLKVAGLTDHQDSVIFTSIRKNGTAVASEEPLSRVSMEKIFKDAWRMMGRDDEKTNKSRYAQWSGHSCRVGATQDLNTSGATLPQIMSEGGWKNPETAMRYLRNVGGVKSAVTDMMKK